MQAYNKVLLKYEYVDSCWRDKVFIQKELYDDIVERYIKKFGHIEPDELECDLPRFSGELGMKMFLVRAVCKRWYYIDFKKRGERSEDVNTVLVDFDGSAAD